MSSKAKLMFWYVSFFSILKVGFSIYIDRYVFQQDEATGITHHLVQGDFAFFHVGSKVKVCHDSLSYLLCEILAGN
jgi:hypothetical protein